MAARAARAARAAIDSNGSNDSKGSEAGSKNTLGTQSKKTDLRDAVFGGVKSNASHQLGHINKHGLGGLSH